MKHILKKSFIVVSVIFVILIGMFLPYLNPSVVHAESIKDTNVEYNSVEKIIDISKEKVCNITEIITVTYKRPGINLGLSRNVSRVNKITRIVNGKSYVTKTINKLTLVSVLMDDEPEFNFVETDNDYYYINTGADGDFKYGKHVYKINYLYDMGEDFIDEFDDFTFDVMDYGFRGDVENFSCQVTLPETFFSSEEELSGMLSFRTNEMSPISSEAVYLSVENNTLKFNYQNFPAENGLTMQLILPNKYFDTSYQPKNFYWVAFGFLILSVLGIVFLILFNRKRKRVVVTPEFYPPENFSPMDVARVYRGGIKSKDFASLVIYWASKGYISITFKDKKNIVLKKLKDLPSYKKRDYLQKSKNNERDYFNAIFSKSDVFNPKKERFKNNFSLRSAIQKLYKKEKSQSKEILLFRVAIHFLAILPMIFFIFWNLSFLGGAYMFFLLLFPVIAILVFTYVPMPIWFKLIWCGIFGGVPMGFLLVNSFVVYDVAFLGYFAVALFLIGNVSALMIKSFDVKSLEYRGKILGFKKFLLTAELDRLKMLVEENPEYYYDILPFCYVFGITKKMQEKFDSLNVPYPTYCEGHSPVLLYSHVSHSMGYIGGGSSSSGGFGGSGGGGGGSSGGGGGGGGCGGR